MGGVSVGTALRFCSFEDLIWHHTPASYFLEDDPLRDDCRRVERIRNALNHVMT